LAALRAKIVEAVVDAFIVHRADAHRGEYDAACDDSATKRALDLPRCRPSEHFDFALKVYAKRSHFLPSMGCIVALPATMIESPEMH
jgi:hypothetical protein